MGRSLPATGKSSPHAVRASGDDPLESTARRPGLGRSIVGFIGMSVVIAVLLTVALAPGVAMTGLVVSQTVGIFQALPGVDRDRPAHPAQPHLRQRPHRPRADRDRLQPEPRGGRLGRDLAVPERRGHRRRRQEFLLARRSGCRVARARGGQQRVIRFSAERSLDHRDAGGAQRADPGCPAVEDASRTKGRLQRRHGRHPATQAQGDAARDRTREGVHQAADPERLPQHRQLRRQQLRRRGGRAGVLLDHGAQGDARRRRRASSPSCRTRRRRSLGNKANYEANESRRNFILGQMYAAGDLTKAQYDRPRSRRPSTPASCIRRSCRTAASRPRCSTAGSATTPSTTSTTSPPSARPRQRAKRTGRSADTTSTRPSTPRCRMRQASILAALVPATETALQPRRSADDRAAGHRQDPRDGREQDLRQHPRAAADTRPPR